MSIIDYQDIRPRFYLHTFPGLPPPRSLRQHPSHASEGNSVDLSRWNSSGEGQRRYMSADYWETTDPKDVTGPVLELVDPALVKAWSIHNDNRMAIIFDAVNPVRQFQRGVPYNDRAKPENAFAKYDPDPKEDLYVTEDEGDEDLKPYEPIFVLSPQLQVRVEGVGS
ncbi:hypothetical protein BJ322DRAFT_1019924 [Thelephora terrestris]|uniref:Uncharacterized protein n=1 Tax=Thelephora terrestris TaxID=56493 RepID=A0A9P6HL34_9AGAM|nr:hypothetical protein BJ322DRAFT_1019924 [Thelephora terrestris]